MKISWQPIADTGTNQYVSIMMPSRRKTKNGKKKKSS